MGYAKALFERAGGNAPDVERHEWQSDMQSVQNLEAVINEGLRVALLKETPDQSLEVLLGYLGKALSGERTYIFERNASGCDDNTYEWVADGVEPEKENLQNVPSEVCAAWYRNFSVGKHIVIENVEEIRKDEPLVYDTLKRQNILSLVVVPLYDNKKAIGFYGVDNPPVKLLEYASNMLQTAAYFIVSSLKRRDLVRELQKRSHNVLHALSVDYLGIFQVNFDTDECETYRDKEEVKADWGIHFEDGYQAAMEQFISRYVIPRDQELLRAVTKRDYVLDRLKRQKKFYVRYRVKDNDYGLKHLEIHFSATEKTEEEHLVIFAQRDVNAVVEQEERYRLEARQSLEDILEGARTGIWTIELEEGCEPRMYADRTMRILLGVSDEIGPEECYRSWFENIEPDYVEMVQEAVLQMQETGRSEVIYPWNHPELGKIYVRCGGVPDREFKKPGVCLNGYHQDITETMVARKKQEQAIMELLEKVRRANSAKSEFLSHMSHDLRTPINGILGMLAIMEKCEEDPERQKDCREKIRVSTERLLTLVNDVLRVSKLGNKSQTAAKEPLGFSGPSENHVTGRPADGRAGNMRSADEGLRSADDRMRSANERVRFTDESTRSADEGMRLMDENTRLVDDGMRSVDKTVRFADKDIRYVEMMQSADRGSRSADEEQYIRDDIAGMHVLLVEDNEQNCEIMEFMLEDAGAKVVTANDGKAAVDAFAASEPGTFDCVLMDLMMPVMSGFEASHVIRGMDRPDAKTVPIIALSANAFEEDVAMAMNAGMNAHLAKPVDINKVFRAMRRRY